jgi:hypothetical protein
MKAGMRFGRLTESPLCSDALSERSCSRHVLRSLYQIQISSYPKVDKSLLAIPELKRVRSKEHLRFVAGQPSLICGGIPAQAHHIRYAQHVTSPNKDWKT